MNEYNNWVYKLTFLSGVVGLLFAFGLGFIIAFNQTKPPSPPVNSAVIQITTAPSGATVLLDGKRAKDGEFTVEPGRHIVEVSKDGFETQTITKQVDNGSIVFMGAALESNSPNTTGWYNQHPKDARLAEGVTGTEAGISGSNAASQTPIIKKLPVNGLTYKINYGAPDENVPISSPTIFIKANSSKDRQSAMNWIRYNGFNPSTMNISFVGTINPFVELSGDRVVSSE